VSKCYYRSTSQIPVTLSHTMPRRPNEPKHPNELRHHGPNFQLILYPESMFLLDRDKPAQREVQEWVEESFGLRL
jgi:hypothetical protein